MEQAKGEDSKLGLQLTTILIVNQSPTIETISRKIG